MQTTAFPLVLKNKIDEQAMTEIYIYDTTDKAINTKV